MNIPETNVSTQRLTHMMNRISAQFYLFTLLCFSYTFTTFAVAQSESAPSGGFGYNQVSARLLSDSETLVPRDSTDSVVGRVGVLLTIKPGWHIYWKNSGEAALPTRVRWTLPNGWSTSELQWPVPNRYHEPGDIVTYGYEGQVLLYADIVSPEVIPLSETPVKISADVSWLVCHDICVPGETRLESTLLFSPTAPLTPSKDEMIFARFRKLAPMTRVDTAPVILKASTVGNSDLVITLDAVPSVPNLVSAVQVFPETVPGIIAGRPTLWTSANPEANDSPTWYIRIPLTIDHNEAKNVVTLPLVLALNHELVKPSGVVLELAAPLPKRGNQEVSGQNNNHFWSSLRKVGEPAYLTVDKSDSGLGPLTSENLPPSTSAGSLALAIISGFVAGLILNLMPCILPLVSIKVMGFVQHSTSSRREIVRAAMAFASGVLASFLGLALTIVFLQSLGIAVGWGLQFHYPQFTFTLSLVVFLLALGFFDLYSVHFPGGSRLGAFANSRHATWLKNFLDGVLVTVLSTPCTAPFLGTALLYAFAQGPAVTIAIFLSIGMGLALPYVVLATNERLIRKLPQPGPWMYRVRQLMGFLLFGTVVWLLFVLSKHHSEAVIWALSAMLSIFFSLWLLQWLREVEIRPSFRRGITGLLALGLSWIVISAWPVLTAEQKSSPTVAADGIWQPYTSSAAQIALERGQIVFIDFTADWCITCKANEAFVLSSDEVQAALAADHVTALKADWTHGDPTVTSALNSYGAKGVPLYVVLAPQKEAQVLSILLSRDAVLNALREARRKNNPATL